MNVQGPQKEHAADSNFLRFCYLEFPDHGQREYDDIDVQDQEKYVLNDPHDVYINAMPFYGLVPGVCNGRALEYRWKDLRDGDSNR